MMTHTAISLLKKLPKIAQKMKTIVSQKFNQDKMTNIWYVMPMPLQNNTTTRWKYFGWWLDVLANHFWFSEHNVVWWLLCTSFTVHSNIYQHIHMTLWVNCFKVIGYLDGVEIDNPTLPPFSQVFFFWNSISFLTRDYHHTALNKNREEQLSQQKTERNI